MKHATLEQKDQIIEKTKETFKVRRYLYLNEHFFNVFPRFLDIPELVCNVIMINFRFFFPNLFLCKIFHSLYLLYFNYIF